jgi:hypothetical protein
MTIERLDEIMALAKDGKCTNYETVEILKDMFVSAYKNNVNAQEKTKELEILVKELTRKLTVLDNKFTFFEKQNNTPLYQLMVDENEDDKDNLIEYLNFVISQNDNPTVNEVIQKVMRYLTNDLLDGDKVESIL